MINAVFEIMVHEGPQFQMGAVEFVGVQQAEVERLQTKWWLKPGAVFDDSYPSQFQLRVNGTWSRRANV